MITDFAVPIASGLTPSPVGAGRLSPRRGAELREHLRLLDAARRSAAVEIRQYTILPGCSAKDTTEADRA